jgi:glycosyltransferase involved in cell wall biosynthesis
MSYPDPRFSVLLPTHNRPDVLGYAIRSVLAQTETSLELLIVADGCLPSTAEVVGRFTDPRIRFFDLPKAPYFGYANRNIALRQARGKYVASAAHDDLWLPDHLELMGQLLDRTGVPWAYSRPLWVSTDGIVVPFGTNLLLPDELAHFLARNNTIPAGCVVHTRQALEEAGYWPERATMMGDWILWTRILQGDSQRLAYLRQPTQLHFRANWKKSRHSNSFEVKRWLSLADRKDWWPTGLKIPSVPGQTVQQTIWEDLEQGGHHRVSQLRDDADTVLTRLAWSHIQRRAPWENPRYYLPLIQVARWLYQRSLKPLIKLVQRV